MKKRPEAAKQLAFHHEVSIGSHSFFKNEIFFKADPRVQLFFILMHASLATNNRNPLYMQLMHMQSQLLSFKVAMMSFSELWERAFCGLTSFPSDV